jgi:hypothetical protein
MQNAEIETEQTAGKMRCDSAWAGLTPEQRETLEGWLFEENRVEPSGTTRRLMRNPVEHRTEQRPVFPLIYGYLRLFTDNFDGGG